jgi:hypothetical protein
MHVNGSVRIQNVDSSNEKIYLSERNASNGPFRYNIPASNAGFYKLHLHFAELYFQNKGRRIFDVSAEGSKIIQDMDIIGIAPAYNAIVQTYYIEVKDGALTLAFTSSAYYAKISAIEVSYIGTVSPPIAPPRSAPVPAPVPVPTRESPLKGAWIVVDSAADLVARHEACFVFDDVTRRAYLLGGRYRQDNRVNIYDPSSRTWSAGASPPNELHHMQVRKENVHLDGLLCF